MSRKLQLLIFLIVFIFSEAKYGYITWHDNKAKVTITDYFADIPDVHVAKATYNNEINSTG